MEENEISRKKRNLRKLIGVSAFFITVFLAAFYYLIILPREEKRESERAQRSRESWIASVLHNSPEALQNSFSDDVKNGVNDQYTKADAYWITHRYSDTLGNIYEIYDYIQSRPHLAFIQTEAEVMSDQAGFAHHLASGTHQAGQFLWPQHQQRHHGNNRHLFPVDVEHRLALRRTGRLVGFIIYRLDRLVFHAVLEAFDALGQIIHD